ncbi:mobile element protein [Microcystis aeruginosa NIES-44]|uniref:Mobile element protein n=1 Tax=Microcystis aeruginosa NIES-44 TaxID=449439 RepID=A0A0A1VWC1_MICAE|nr:mobile element protein [Microcystis aeruginosa NIES-44]
MGFLKGNSLPKLGVTCDFIAQSQLLGGRTPQIPRWGRVDS